MTGDHRRSPAERGDHRRSPTAGLHHLADQHRPYPVVERAAGAERLLR